MEKTYSEFEASDNDDDDILFDEDETNYLMDDSDVVAPTKYRFMGDYESEEEPPATEEDVLNVVELIKAKHRSEFDQPKEFPKKKERYTRERREKAIDDEKFGRKFSSTDKTKEHLARSLILSQIRRRRLIKNIDEQYCPEINDKFPEPDKKKLLKFLESDPLLEKASGGFRFFLLKFTDEFFNRCINNPLFDTLKGNVPANLRYIHIIRNVWKSLPELDRQEWQLLFNRCYVNDSVVAVCSQSINEDKCIDGFQLSSQQMEDRYYLSTIEQDSLPCPLCNRSNEKRYTQNELFAHISCSHASVRFYACHICSRIFSSPELLAKHSTNCREFETYQSEIIEGGKTLEFEYAYISLMCSDCGLHLILSSGVSEEAFTYAFINCLVSHCSDNFLLLMIFTCLELPENYVKLSFLRCFSSKLMECEHCADEKTIRNIYEMEKHLSTKHRKDIKSTKCPRCPASFFFEEAFADHLFSHMPEIPSIVHFLTTAPVMPSPLEKNPRIRIGAKSLKTFNSEQNARLSLHKNKAKSVDSEESAQTEIEEKELADLSSNGTPIPAESQKKWMEYSDGGVPSYDDLMLGKGVSDITLDVVYTDKVIVENTLNGSLLMDNVFQCMKCFTICIGNSSIAAHIATCFGMENETTTTTEIEELIEKKSPEHLKQLFDAANFPFTKISCGLCDSKHCSVNALRRHYILKHTKLCKFQKNNTTIQQCAELIQRKDWIKTEFDRELIRLIKLGGANYCKSEFDSGYDFNYYENEEPKNSNNNNNNCDGGDGENSSSLKNVNEKKNSTLELGQSISPTPTNELFDKDIKHEFLTNHNDLLLNNTDNEIESNDDEEEEEEDGEIPTKRSKLMVSRSTSSISNDLPPNITRDLFVKEDDSSSLPQQPKSLINLNIEEDVGDCSRSSSNTHLDVVASKRYCCFLCAQPVYGTENLVKHLETHPEKWNKCQLCVRDKIPVYPEFNALMDFYKHMKFCHVVLESTGITKCTFCEKIFNNGNKQMNTNEMIRHLIYDCLRINLCMLCDQFSRDVDENFFFEKLTFHRQHRHRLIYDRYICGSCKSGFYSIELFRNHVCDKALRCICNENMIFYTQQDYTAHLSKSLSEEPKGFHDLVNTRIEKNPRQRKLEFNEDYKKLNAKLLEEEEEANNKQSQGGFIINNSEYRIKPAGHKQQRTTTDSSVGGGVNDHEVVVVQKYGRYNDTNKPEETIIEEVLYNIIDRVLIRERKIQRSQVRKLHKLQASLVDLKAIKESKKPDEEIIVINTKEAPTNTKPKYTVPRSMHCKTCKKQFHSPNELLKHERTHPQPSNKEIRGVPFGTEMYLCRACCLAFESIKEFNIHINSHSAPIACKKCSTVVRRDTDYYTHRNFHRNPGNIYACSICKTHYLSDFTLLFHMAKMHETILAYFCKCCSICYTKGNDLMAHIRDTPCRKMLNIEFIGMCDAAQIRFQPSNLKEYNNKVANGLLESVKPSDCRHFCLLAAAEAILTCIKCNCPITITHFRKNCMSGNENTETHLATDYQTICNGPPSFIKMMFELSEEYPSARKDKNKSLRMEKNTSKVDKRFGASIKMDNTTLQQNNNSSCISIKSEPQQPSTSNDNVDIKPSLSTPTTAIRRFGTTGDIKVLGMSQQKKTPLYVISDRQQQQYPPGSGGCQQQQQIQRQQQYPRMERPQQQCFPIEHQYTRVIPRSLSQQRYSIEGGAIQQQPQQQQLPKRSFLYRQSQLPTTSNSSCIGGGIYRSSPYSLPQQQQRLIASSMQYNSSGSRILTTKRPISQHYQIRPMMDKNGLLVNEPQINVPVRVGMGISYGEKRFSLVDSERNLPMGRQPRVLVPTTTITTITTKTPNTKPSSLFTPQIVVPSILDDKQVVIQKLEDVNFRNLSEKYMCASCNDIHTNQQQAVLHQFMKHNIKEIQYHLTCPIEGKSFSDIKLFYSHLNFHHEHHFQHISKSCTFRFRSAKEVEAHNSEHEKANSRRTRKSFVGGQLDCCGLCGTVRDYWMAVLPSDEHIIIDHTVFHGFQNLVICKICNEMFLDDHGANKINIHFQNKHVRVQFLNNTETCLCKTCEEIVEHENINDHLRERHIFTMVEFLAEKNYGNLVIEACSELEHRFQ